MNSKFLSRVAYACGTFGHDIFYAMVTFYFMMFVTSNLFNSGDVNHDEYMISLVTTLILIIRIAELFGSLSNVVVSRSSNFFAASFFCPFLLLVISPIFS